MRLAVVVLYEYDITFRVGLNPARVPLRSRTAELHHPIQRPITLRGGLGGEHRREGGREQQAGDEAEPGRDAGGRFHGGKMQDRGGKFGIYATRFGWAGAGELLSKLIVS